VGCLDTKFRGYFELFFIMAKLGNLYTNVRGYFKLSTNLGVYFKITS